MICFGDFNGDDHVGVEDLMELLGAFGFTNRLFEPTTIHVRADLDGDGEVHVGDLLLLLGVYGADC